MRLIRFIPLVLAAGLVLLGFALLTGSSALRAAAQVSQTESSPGEIQPQAPALTTADGAFYLPMIIDPRPPVIRLAAAHTGISINSPRFAFLPGSDMQYVTRGYNDLPFEAPISLHWTQSGPCGPSVEVFSDTISATSGVWTHAVPGTAPECLGVYTTTLEAVFVGSTTLAYTEEVNFVVSTSSALVPMSEQGFDRCRLPSVAEMQAWWDNSPYYAFNIYLGGISFFCSSNPLDSVWVYEVAQQGWAYILTWVGPQAPCTSFTHRFSSEPVLAYLEGRGEADLAYEKARQLGFLGELLLHYDMEAYSHRTCGTAVNEFLRGWTDRLHELGVVSGGYGTACSVGNWATNGNPPDEIWFAYWTYPFEYKPNESVFLTPPACPLTGLWTNHQRIKQYAGDHSEAWPSGGVSMTIDSNVLDGRVNVLPPPSAPAQAAAPVIFEQEGASLRAARLIAPGQGWVLQGDRLLLTSDGGISWRDITPAGGSILGAGFATLLEGWVVQRSDSIQNPGLVALHTRDGGTTWETHALPASEEEVLLVESASVEIQGGQFLWVGLKLQTSSAFSVGRLYASEDGGTSWDRRSLPLGESITFLDEKNGWTAGGAAGDQVYATHDGGRTWQPVSLSESGAADTTALQLGRPVFFGGELHIPVMGGTQVVLSSQDGVSWNARSSSELLPNLMPFGAGELDVIDASHGWAIVQEGGCEGAKLVSDPATAEPFVCHQDSRLLQTTDSGKTWQEITPAN